MKSLKEKKVAQAVKDVILEGEQLKVTVKTGSMSPLLGRGDKILVEKCAPQNLHGGI